MSNKKLFLLDGNALVYRAHFAFISRPLINSKGLNTSAITGFVRSLWDILSNQKPTHIAVSFDMPGDTFRHKMFPAYKANREAQPEDISTALPYIKSIIEGFNIPIVTLAGYEADDIIGTLSKQAEKQGFTVYMVTPDKDFGQLVSEHIYMFKPSRRGNGVDILGVSDILKQWQVKRIDQVIDMLGLQGDSVDNIPGIPGIGPKTAAKLLAEYDTIEGLIAHSHELKGKQKERVDEFHEQAILSKELATIDTDAPVTFDEKAYRLSAMNREKLGVLFKDLEFRTLSQAILGPPQTGVQQDLFGNAVAATPERTSESPPPPAMADYNIKNTDHEYILVDSLEKRRDLLVVLQNAQSFCFDTETTGLDANEAKLIGLSISLEAGKGYWVPVPDDAETARDILQEFKSVFENDGISKIGQNLKYDALILKWYGIEVQGHFNDTMIAHYLLEPGTKHALDYLAETYLNYEPMKIEALIGRKGINQITMRQADPEKVSEYAVEDADLTLQLHEILFRDLKKEGLHELYQKIEEPLIKVLVDLEHAGINIDEQYLHDYSQELGEQLLDLESEIYKLAGLPFNIASPRQVGEVLFDRLKIPYRWRRTKTGQYSTDEDKLTELSKDHEIVEVIMQHRMFSKLKSTYVDALPLLINPKTRRIHSSFNQALAATGRLSSNNPNLQNIPIRTPEGRRIRKAFIPKDHQHVLLSADYSQIELRLIAEISKDDAMLEAFQKGQDIHRATAARVYDVPYDEVTADQRRNAKTVNFSITYGAGSTNLSRQLSISRKEAKILIEQYFKQYAGLKRYMDDTVEFARANGYVETLLGRKRKLRDINSRNGMSRSGAERIAINTPIQGTAADMIKLAMIDIHSAMKAKHLRSQMILQVHDELVFDVPKDEQEVMEVLIEDKMKHAIPDLKVPIVVGMGVGADWLEAH